MSEDKEIPNLFTIQKFAQKNRERGTWPYFTGSLYALRDAAPQNGFGNAFVKIGGRILIDEEKFWETVAQSREKKNE